MLSRGKKFFARADGFGGDLRGYLWGAPQRAAVSPPEKIRRFSWRRASCPVRIGSRDRYRMFLAGSAVSESSRDHPFFLNEVQHEAGEIRSIRAQRVWPAGTPPVAGAAVGLR
jgi:hypothetical protein